MLTRKDARRDEWDARTIPAPERRSRGRGRNQGLTLMLLGIGLPLIVFFIQVDGAVRFSSKEMVFERTLTSAEQQEIRAAIQARKAGLDTVQRIVETIKEKYRGETGASYERDVWIVRVKEGLAVPYMYVLAAGALIFLVGIGKLVI
ncbi:MAG TPA: hypothetical protein P5119_04260 [Candidatus Aminicenantes bacterium]|nr:hypothetical protein [Candidatus Aminicenantes bacterium]HRY64538.1 hypothetical protein [Candidatus Aminicenantes bacterium]HRZ71451.1 hypothetical protein [Candidatus Aminicenantes bacterium]